MLKNKDGSWGENSSEISKKFIFRVVVHKFIENSWNIKEYFGQQL
jgi:hypothetical protein